MFCVQITLPFLAIAIYVFETVLVNFKADAFV